MSVITAAQSRAAAKSLVNEGNMNSVLVSLEKFRKPFERAGRKATDLPEFLQ